MVVFLHQKEIKEKKETMLNVKADIAVENRGRAAETQYRHEQTRQRKAQLASILVFSKASVKEWKNKEGASCKRKRTGLL